MRKPVLPNNNICYVCWQDASRPACFLLLLLFLRLYRIPATPEVIRVDAHVCTTAGPSSDRAVSVLTALPCLAPIGVLQQIFVLEAGTGGNVDHGTIGRQRRVAVLGARHQEGGRRCPVTEFGDRAHEQNALVARGVALDDKGDAHGRVGRADGGGDNLRRAHFDCDGGPVVRNAAIAVCVLDVLYFAGDNLAVVVVGRARVRYLACAVHDVVVGEALITVIVVSD